MNCVIRWWNIFSEKLPDWNCWEAPPNLVVDSQFTWGFSIETVVPYTLFIFGVGLFGATLIEWLNNKLEWIIDPLIKKIQERYSFVVERNRLKTMNGHP